MTLQLAEKPRKTYNVKGYKRPASRVRAHKRRFLSDEGADDNNPYVFIPDINAESGGYFIREDYFDFMDSDEFAQLLYAIAPYQPQVETGAMSEDYFLASRATRKARREERKELRIEKKAAKVDIKKAKAAGIQNGTWTGGGGILNNVLDTAKSIFGGGGDSAAVDNSAGGVPQYEDRVGWFDRETFGINNKVVAGIAGAAGLITLAVVIHRRKKRKK